MLCGGGHAWQVACVAGGIHGGGCMAGGVHGRGACVAGGHVWQGGVHAMHTPWTPRDMVGQCAGGMHPTGMHSCSFFTLGTSRPDKHVKNVEAYFVLTLISSKWGPGSPVNLGLLCVRVDFEIHSTTFRNGSKSLTKT